MTNRTDEFYMFYIGLDQNGVWNMFRAPDRPKQEDLGHQFISVRGPYETERRALYAILYANVDKSPVTLWQVAMGFVS